MVETLKHNKLIIGLLALFIAAAAWYTLGDSGSGSDLLVTEDFVAPSSQTDKDLVATLLQLRAVTLDGTIFGDPVFRSLQDFGSQIVPEPVGRTNPFAPLDKQGTTTATKSPPSTAPKR